MERRAGVWRAGEDEEALATAAVEVRAAREGLDKELSTRDVLAGQLHSATSGPASSCRKNSRPGSVGMKLLGTHGSGP